MKCQQGYLTGYFVRDEPRLVEHSNMIIRVMTIITTMQHIVLQHAITLRKRTLSAVCLARYVEMY